MMWKLVCRLNNDKFENTLALVAVADPRDPTVAKYQEAVLYGKLRYVSRAAKDL
jgi:hypothetical protein